MEHLGFYLLPLVFIWIVILYCYFQTNAKINRIWYILCGICSFIPLMGMIVAVSIFAAIIVFGIANNEGINKSLLKDTKLNRFLFNKLFEEEK